DADQRPAGRAPQDLVEPVETRNLRLAHAHRILRLQEGVAGQPGQQLALAAVELPLDRVIGGAVGTPGLLDHAGGVERHVALVGHRVLDALRGVHGRSLRAALRGRAVLTMRTGYPGSCAIRLCYCAMWRAWRNLPAPIADHTQSMDTLEL